jgi:hypothetical protein
MINQLMNVSVSKPKPFLNIGEIGEIDGRYYRLENINDMRNIACFSEIKIHKLRYSSSGVEVVE